MKILLVSATELEIRELLLFFKKVRKLNGFLTRYTYADYRIDVLITGVGMVQTAVFTTLYLQKYRYDVAINAGIAGSFNKNLAIGEVCNVTSDYFPELGAESPQGFLSIIDLKLLNANDFPFTDGKIINTSIFDSQLLKQVTEVSGVTVNKSHGKSRHIKQFLSTNPVDLESMEGAAFMYVAKLYGIRFMQVRSISNYIETRDTSTWNIPLAVKNLNEFILNLLNE